MIEFILKIQNKFYKYRNNEKYLIKILKNGADKARVLANKKMEKVKKIVGLK